MKHTGSFWRRWFAIAGFLWLGSLLPAEAPPAGALSTVQWDATVTGPFPDWFGPVQSFSSAQATIWRASIRPPPGSSRLAATFVFEETPHGVARLIWQGVGRSLVLCPNLFEGAATWHQRTLLLGRETLGAGGQLVVESIGSRPTILRAEFSWVEPLVLAATGWMRPGLFISPSGKIFPDDELNALPRGVAVDEYRHRMVDAVLDPGPVRCEPNTPVRFLSSITQEPAFGRVQARVAGLRPNEEPEIWVNGWRLPMVSLEVPGLDDPGYRWLREQGSVPDYGGWRYATAFIPPGWLRRGENHVEWISPSGAKEMTLRHLRLQLSYDTDQPTAPDSLPAATPAVSVPSVSKMAPSPQLRLGLSSRASELKIRSE